MLYRCIRRRGREKNCFPNKKDGIVQQLKKCRDEIFEIFTLSKNNERQIENKRSFPCGCALHWLIIPKQKNYLREDPVGITLIFDGWTVNNYEQLLGVVLMTSEGRPFVWKAAILARKGEHTFK
ncbi:unnamed protein product [Rhizophagus irregularis]|nr:unnamed protein product [Rhizophagus irregularis]